ncbi:hypothetical protein [Pantoea ananatis]|uniref:hypothetical protein n=1 Tax=Pantoea ananas TaxID=553 RepID=UPI00048FCA02|nr:hypothetical protein [Pantoea ananatis]
MEIKLTAKQVAEIVNSDERVKQAVVSLQLQRCPAILTISDLPSKTAEDVYIEQEKEKAVAIMQEYFPNGGRDYDAVCALFDAIADHKVPCLGLVYP